MQQAQHQAAGRRKLLVVELSQVLIAGGGRHEEGNQQGAELEARAGEEEPGCLGNASYTAIPKKGVDLTQVAGSQGFLWNLGLHPENRRDPEEVISLSPCC